MAKIYCEKCNGCGDCCHGMTDTIHLDPYDVEQLRRNLGKSFDEMLQHEIGLHVEQGMILPHLLFQDTGDGNNVCPFLDADNRCQIHAFRPGFCRLFPLGRDYDADTKRFRYFIVDAGCDMPGKMKMKISKWLDIPHLAQYEQFVTDWHYFCKDVQKSLSAPNAQASSINQFILTVFYLTPYPAKEDFYRLFQIRLNRAREAL